MEQTSYSLCLLRLSALGDITHVVPLVRTLQRELPKARLHWIIDTPGSKLLDGLDGVHLHVYDKRTGLTGMRALRAKLTPLGQFDALLQMQVALRANLLSAFVPARCRIGYDHSRSKDLHGLFINQRIPNRPGIHVLDAIGSFCEPLGLVQREVHWDLPVSEEARAWAWAQWDNDGQPVLMISPAPVTSIETGKRNATQQWPSTPLHRAGESYYAVAAAHWNGRPQTQFWRRLRHHYWIWLAKIHSNNCQPSSNVPT